MKEFEVLLWELVDLVRRVSPEIWRLTVRQSVVEGIAIALIGAMILIFAGLLWYCAIRADKKIKANEASGRMYANDTEERFWLMAWATIATVIGSAPLIMAFTILANPQYNAMNKLINFVR